MTARHDPPADPRLADFPPLLRQLLAAELAAGNTIVEVASCFPAPPIGAYAKLARPVGTRPRASGDGLDFRARNSSLWSGEFTDARRQYFVLEPPGEVPDDAPGAARPQPSAPTPPRVEPADEPLSATARFSRSMVIDYEKWHDGIGYDLDLLRTATAVERAALEAMLLARPVEDWRDVEALAALGSAAADDRLRHTLSQGRHQLRLAVVQYAPRIATEAERAAVLARAIRSTSLFDGLSAALDEAAGFHPPEVIEALLYAARHRDGEAAIHCAAMLLFVHGKAKEPFDWDHRPFCLRFHDDARGDREAAFRELCVRIGRTPPE